MSTVISVWSKVLLPGQDTLISEDVSIQVTNITLEVDESSTTSSASTIRSIVKMQHLEAEPALLRAAAGYQLSSDSEDDSDIDSEEEEDEDDGNEGLSAEDDSKIQLAAGSSKIAKRKNPAAVNGHTNGIVPTEGIDISDEEDDVDFDESEYDRRDAEIQICSLLPGTIEQVQTNLILPGGEDFVLKLSGTSKVHLFGHYIVQPCPSQFDEPPYGESGEYDSDEITSEDEDDMSESEMGRFDPETGLAMYADDSEDDDDDEDVDDSRFMELEDEKSPKKSKQSVGKVAMPLATAKSVKKIETAPALIPTADTLVVASQNAINADKTRLSKNQLKKLARKGKDSSSITEPNKEKALPASDIRASATTTTATASNDKKTGKTATASTATTTAAATAAKKTPSKKQVLSSGLSFEDNKVGTGVMAKSGQKVQMRYIGRLQNGKIFDQNTKGTPFSFKLGKGEVIKGWDQGITGMQVGGERKLVIPPTLAYGKQAIAGIPANSTLTFEVKLLSIK